MLKGKKLVDNHHYITKNYVVKFNTEDNSMINYKGVKYQNPEYKANQKGRNDTHNFTNYLDLEGCDNGSFQQKRRYY